MFEGVSTTVIILFLIALLLLLLCITLGSLIVYSGLFITPEVGAGKPPIGKVVLAYRFCKGPYKESGQTFTEAVIIAPEKQTLGIYYDDPRKVEASNLRYVVGSIISKDSEPIEQSLVKKFTEKGFKIMNLPEVDHVVRTNFPFITALSVMIGIYKVYPRMNQYIEERNLCAYPFLEYSTDQLIHYFAPLSKQEDFYAPECEPENNEEKWSSDFNETLESTQSTITESFHDTIFDSNDEVTPSADEDEKLDKILMKQELSPIVGDDKGDKAVDENIDNSDGDAEDNSSSSSFEVVKDETKDL